MVSLLVFFLPIYVVIGKGFNTQRVLLALFETLRKGLINKVFHSAILMDLSKVFDALNHDLLTVKLHGNGFQHEALKLLCSYLSKRWHRTKVNMAFSSWGEVIKSVPQGSVLGPLLFNLLLNDILYFADFTEFCNFVDNATFHTRNSNLNNLIERLEHHVLLANE